MSDKTNELALIDADNCIGCHVCVRECPFDAIIGVNEMLHQIIFDLCTGCGLCIDPCPTNCIEMVSTGSIKTKTIFVSSGKNKILAKIKKPKSKDRFNKTSNNNDEQLIDALLDQARLKKSE
jgi:RnfABCDGE-type electron transport complex B subunit